MLVANIKRVLRRKREKIYSWVIGKYCNKFNSIAFCVKRREKSGRRG
jgi:hypothetical protein